MMIISESSISSFDTTVKTVSLDLDGVSECACATSRQHLAAISTATLQQQLDPSHHNYTLVQRSFSTNPPKEPTTNIDEFRQREEKRDQEDEANASADQTDADKNARIASIRESILNAALPFVPQYGWSREAIEHGATSINMPGIVHGLFPGGSIELVQHFALTCDRKLIEQLRAALPLKKQPEGGDALLPEFAFVADAIRMRLEMLEPVRAQWSSALAVRANPVNASVAIKQTLRMVDDICYLAGDRSADIKWYTRRIAVATLYKVTEMHWLQDRSPGCQDTWAFLQRRIRELNQVQRVVGDGSSTGDSISSLVRTVADTAKNMVGAPFGRI